MSNRQSIPSAGSNGVPNSTERSNSSDSTASASEYTPARAVTRIPDRVGELGLLFEQPAAVGQHDSHQRGGIGCHDTGPPKPARISLGR